jgi:hypothetical protein
MMDVSPSPDQSCMSGYRLFSSNDNALHKAMGRYMRKASQNGNSRNESDCPDGRHLVMIGISVRKELIAFVMYGASCKGVTSFNQ